MTSEDMRAALSGPVLEVAPALLGARVVSTIGGQRVVVALTEVEAYDGTNDPGSHAFRGPTPRTQVMFGPAGHWYVYFSYGMHWCVNVVTGVEGAASAVLLRAGRVVEGHDVARARRPAARNDRDLARGPARLASCLGIDKTLWGASVLQEPLRLELPDGAAVPHSSGPRVGVAGEGGDPARFPWRYWATDDPTVSVFRPGATRVGRINPPA